MSIYFKASMWSCGLSVLQELKVTTINFYIWMPGLQNWTFLYQVYTTSNIYSNEIKFSNEDSSTLYFLKWGTWNEKGPIYDILMSSPGLFLIVNSNRSIYSLYLVKLYRNKDLCEIHLFWLICNSNWLTWTEIISLTIWTHGQYSLTNSTWILK